MINLFTQQQTNMAQGGIGRNSRPQIGDNPNFTVGRTVGDIIQYIQVILAIIARKGTIRKRPHGKLQWGA